MSCSVYKRRELPKKGLINSWEQPGYQSVGNEQLYCPSLDSLVFFYSLFLSNHYYCCFIIVIVFISSIITLLLYFVLIMKLFLLQPKRFTFSFWISPTQWGGCVLCRRWGVNEYLWYLVTSWAQTPTAYFRCFPTADRKTQYHKERRVSSSAWRDFIF